MFWHKEKTNTAICLITTSCSPFHHFSLSGSHKMSILDGSIAGEIEVELKVCLGKVERDCRICQLGLELDCGGQEYGVPIELGCSCKGDLGTAHEQCAETWFKIKGNLTCEICGAIALEVREEMKEARIVAHASQTSPVAPVIIVESRTFCHGRSIMNFLLASMVFAFVISWIFHFDVL